MLVNDVVVGNSSATNFLAYGSPLNFSPKMSASSVDVSLEDLITDIKFYLRQMGQNVIEIGTRLNLAKEKVPHGEWQRWLKDNFGFTDRTARNFMSVAERFGKTEIDFRFGSTQMIQMLALPVGEETKFIEEQTAEGLSVSDMSVKALRKAVKRYNNKHCTAKESQRCAESSKSLGQSLDVTEMVSVSANESVTHIAENTRSEVETDDNWDKMFSTISIILDSGNLQGIVTREAKKDLSKIELQLASLSDFRDKFADCVKKYKEEQAAQSVEVVAPTTFEAQVAVLPAKTLAIDLETYCDLDIKEVGYYKYAQNCKLLLCAYAFDDEPIEIVDLAMGEELPQRFLDALFSPDVLKTAYNAQFEIRVLSEYFGKDLDTSQWDCTMVMGSQLGLPAGLDFLGQVLDLPSDKKKLDIGKKLIKYFCQPRKVADKHFLALWDNADSLRNLPQDNLEKWVEFKAYCMRDVEAERAIRSKLAIYARSALPETERQLWCLDQKINNAGVLVDMAYAAGAVKIDAAIKSEAIARGEVLTGGLNINSNAQMLEWISQQVGRKITSLDKAARAELLVSDDITPQVRECLELRESVSKTSVKKYETMLTSACSDSRIRGTLQFYGASHTGRWSGRGVQFQNLPQNHFTVSELDAMRPLITNGDLNALESAFDCNPYDILSQCIRPAIIAPNGCKLIVSDFSSIEARILAYYAEEQWRLDVFAKGGDIYCASASEMFKVPVEKHGVNKELRAKGKIAELACGFGGGSAALKAFGADKMGLTSDEIESIVKKWRENNPKICKFWRSVNRWVVKAVKTGSRVEGCKGLWFEVIDDYLFITLPSGRKLSYYKPQLAQTRKVSGNRFFVEEYITYEGTSQDNGGWMRHSTWGGKLVENIVQAIARDCLADAMLKLDKLGYKIVMHVHDEIIIETPEDADALEEILTVMGQSPAWAPNLLLSADGYETAYYRKD